MESSKKQIQLNFKEKILRFILETVVALFNLLPIKIRIKFIEIIFKVILFIKPKYRTICLKNINQVFPDKDTAFKENIYKESITSVARLFVDLLRISSLSVEAFNQLFTKESFENIEKIKNEVGKENIVFLSGHLGTFEFIPFLISTNGFNFSVVARELKQNWIQSWIVDARSKFNTNVIPREGAYKKILRTLKEKGNIGLVFDQNVTLNHAVFVDFFGRQAATTFAPATAALEYRSKVVMTATRYVGIDKYQEGPYNFDISIFDCDDIYSDETLSKQEKIKAITQRMTNEFEKMLLKQPHAWFWMHKRWKTTEDGVEEFYGK